MAACLSCAHRAGGRGRPWSLPEGAQQWLATIPRETGDSGDAWRADDFTEFGLGDGWGLNFKVESEIRINETFDDRSGVRVGLQKAFAVGERGSIAIQASALLGESLDAIECEGEGYEVRAAAGTSFNVWGREGFVTAEIGHRARDNCTRDVGEVAMGLNFAPDRHVNLKAGTEDGGETGVAEVEASLMRDFWGIGVGVGWREEISGNFEEKGWVLNGRLRFQGPLPTIRPGQAFVNPRAGSIVKGCGVGRALILRVRTMAREKPIEVITPPNVLKTKVGGALPALDQRAIARAEAALEKMSDQFADWINEELAHLLKAWAAYEKAPGSATKDELHRRAHDLKGLAPTYGYPLVGRICATLCKLTGDEHGKLSPPDRLLKAHVDAVKAAIMGKIMGANHPVGLALAAELESQTKEIIVSQAPPAA